MCVTAHPRTVVRVDCPHMGAMIGVNCVRKCGQRIVGKGMCTNSGGQKPKWFEFHGCAVIRRTLIDELYRSDKIAKEEVNLSDAIGHVAIHVIAICVVCGLRRKEDEPHTRHFAEESGNE